MIDDTPPIPFCQDTFLDLNALTGTATLLVSHIQASDPTDNCNVQSATVTASRYSFDCTDVGLVFTATQVVRDVHNNVASCTSQVTIRVSFTTPNIYIYTLMFRVTKLTLLTFCLFLFFILF